MDKSPANVRDADMVCEIVSAFFDIRVRDLHIARHAVARDVAIYFARFCASVPAAQVAERFNVKPATIRNAIASHERRCAADPHFAVIVRRIERVASISLSAG